MKFRTTRKPISVLEEAFSDIDYSTIREIGVTPEEILENIINEEGIDYAVDVFLEKIYPELSEREKNEIIENARIENLSIEDYLKQIDIDYLVDYFIDYPVDVFDKESILDYFIDNYEGEIAEYLSEPTIDELHNEWNSDYYSSRL